MTFRNPHSLFMTPCTLITITSLAWSPIKLPPTCCSLGREVLHLNPKTVLSGDKTPKCSLVHGPSEQVIYLIRLLLAAATHAVNLFFATSVMSFYHMNLEVIADICFGARESVVKSWLPLLRSWTCQCVFFSDFLIWKAGILTPAFQVNLKSWRGKCTLYCVQLRSSRAAAQLCGISWISQLLNC